jgi:hypothetical protein
MPDDIYLRVTQELSRIRFARYAQQIVCLGENSSSGVWLYTIIITPTTTPTRSSIEYPMNTNTGQYLAGPQLPTTEGTERLLTLFEKCHSRGDALQLDITSQLVHETNLPLPSIVQLLKRPSFVFFNCLSADERSIVFHNPVRPTLSPVCSSAGYECVSTRLVEYLLS